MNRFKELNERVIQWADDKGILEKGTPVAQHEKTQEEVTELKEAIFAQNNGLEHFFNSKNQMGCTEFEIVDAIGDVLVTLLIQSYMQNLKPLDCLESALSVIEQRNGKMIDGVFVKDK